MKRYVRNALMLGMWTIISMGIGVLGGTMLGAWLTRGIPSNRTYGPPRTQNGPDGSEKESKIKYAHQ